MKHLTFLLFAFSFQLSAFSQEAAPSAALPADPIAQWVVGQAVAHPWLVALSMLVAGLRGVFKPLLSLVHNYVEHTPGKQDDALLAKAENSTAFRVFAYLLDYFASIKLTRPESFSSTTKLFAPLLLAGVLSAGVGCESLSATQRDGLRDAAKLAARVALQLGLGELTQRVNELQPYAPRLGLLIETAFATDSGQRSAVSPAALGAQLKAHVLATVPAALQAEVLDAMRDALAKSAPPAAAATGREHQQDFNTALILGLR